MRDTKLTKIYLVRHGESEANSKEAEGDYINAISEFNEYGAPLTEKGRKQAAELAEKLKDIHFDAFFSSDLVRAQDTAKAIALKRNLAINASNLIRERTFSGYARKLNRTNRSEIENEMQKDLALLDDVGKMQYKHTPHMESAEEGAVRLITFLREIALAYSGKTVLVANHGNLIRSILTHLGWATFDEMPHGSVENIGYVVLESDGVDFYIKETHSIYKKENAKRIW